MPGDNSKSRNYDSLSSAKTSGSDSGEQQTLRPSKRSEQKQDKQELIERGLGNGNEKPEHPISSDEVPDIVEPSDEDPADATQTPIESEELPVQNLDTKTEVEAERLSYAENKKIQKEIKRRETDSQMISSDTWLARNGHNITYIGLFLFSFWVFFRPYELIPGLGFLSPVAFYIAAATLLIFLPTQFATEGNFSAPSTEVKCVVALALIALITMPIARSPGLAWETFNDNFIKAVLMFIVMVNVLRNRRRLVALMWLSISIGLYLSYVAWTMYLRGEFTVEGNRVGLEMGGMFGNPNDMAMHLVIMTPIVIVLGLASRVTFIKVVYFGIALLLVLGNMVTFSRGGFLGLVAVGGVLAWKLGRKQRLNVALATVAITALLVLFAPGNYGQRILSIFDSSLDAFGSSNQRTELLKRSILVTARNPWGIGIGNFPIVGVQHLGTHNAYTQVSSELGVLGLLAYLIFLVSPFRKLAAIERTVSRKNQFGWYYYLSIGLQASLAGFMVSSFFAAVAYNWFIYYLIAYAVAFRRIYRIGTETEEVSKEPVTTEVAELQPKSA